MRIKLGALIKLASSRVRIIAAPLKKRIAKSELDSVFTIRYTVNRSLLIAVYKKRIRQFPAFLVSYLDDRVALPAVLDGDLVALPFHSAATFKQLAVRRLVFAQSIIRQRIITRLPISCLSRFHRVETCIHLRECCARPIKRNVGKLRNSSQNSKPGRSRNFLCQPSITCVAADDKIGRPLEIGVPRARAIKDQFQYALASPRQVYFITGHPDNEVSRAAHSAQQESEATEKRLPGKARNLSGLKNRPALDCCPCPVLWPIPRFHCSRQRRMLWRGWGLRGRFYFGCASWFAYPSRWFTLPAKYCVGMMCDDVTAG